MNVKIASPAREDLERLIDIYSAPHLYNTKEEATKYVKQFHDYHHIKVVNLNDALAGMLTWRFESEKHHGIMIIDDLWIEERFRQRGLGQKLVKASIEDAENVFRKAGFALRKVMLTTAEDNVSARRLYEKLGFEKSAVLEDLYGKGKNELIYILTLNP
jgi:ribosomal protein S18 acetylase RimI-like enzyme